MCSGSGLVNSQRDCRGPGKEGWGKAGYLERAGETHIGLIATGFKDELFWLVLPTLHRSIGGSQAGRTEGQLGLTGLLL